MKLPRLNEKIKDYTFFGFLIPFMAMLFVMAANSFTPFGDSSMLYSDKYHQYFPFFKAFRENLRNGESLLYSWDVGMGMDYLGLISYYLASPLNLLSVILPDSWVLGYFEMLVPIRLGLSGLFFALFLKKIFKRTDFSIAIFGSFYALCAWALGYQWNVMWMDTFALLPLVALGTVSLLKDKKFILYTFTLFLSVFSNYYIGFFTCIFVLLVFICYEICRWESFKKFFFDLCRIALFSLLAIGMTAILELPTLAALGTTQSSVNKYPEDFALNMADRKLYSKVNAAWDAAKAAWDAGTVKEAFSQGWIAFKGAVAGIWDGMKICAGNMQGGLTPTFKEGLPNLYCGIGTIIFAFLFLTTGKVKLRDKICSVFLLLFIMISFIVRQLDYIWHGFHFTNMIPYRFSFLYSFILLYMAYRAWVIRRSFKIWQVAIACGLAIFLTVSSDAMTAALDKIKDPAFQSNYDSLMDRWSGSQSDYDALAKHILVYAYPVINGLFLLLYTGLLGAYSFPALIKKGAKKDALQISARRRSSRRNLCTYALLTVMGIELMLNVCNYSLNFTGTSIVNYPKGLQDSATIVETMEKREKDTLFYRAETTHSQTLNDGALNGYNGISTFTSSANVKVTEFMRTLGYGAKNTYNRYCFEESSPVANLFLGLKYMIERDGKVEPNAYFDTVASSGNVYLLENNAYLPLGFLAESELAELSFENYSSRFYFQNQLIRAATGMEEDVWYPIYEDCLQVAPETEQVTLKSGSQSSTASYSATGKGPLTFTYTCPIEGFLCIDINQTKRNSYTVWHNGTQLYSESYSLPQMISVCDVVPGDTVQIKFSCTSGDKGSITVSANILDETSFRKAYDILDTSVLELTEFDTTRISGTIRCDRDGLLYTSIPQNSDCWRVYVDGKPAQIRLVGDVMIGVELTQGEHTVTFQYKNTSFTLGLWVSLGCLAITVALWVLWYKPDFQKASPKRLWNKAKGLFQRSK